MLKGFQGFMVSRDQDKIKNPKSYIRKYVYVYICLSVYLLICV